MTVRNTSKNKEQGLIVVKEEEVRDRKCPTCSSTRIGLYRAPTGDSIDGALAIVFDYECLMCGTRWQELSIDREKSLTKG